MKKAHIYKLSISAVLVLLISISACVKDITVDIPQAETGLVVDGYIDFDDYPVVYLSTSMAYFQEGLDSNAVNETIITDEKATVIVSDGLTDDTLEYLPIAHWPYRCFRGTKFKGQLNTRYDLKIIYEGQTYTSSTSIPDTITIEAVQSTFMSDTFAVMQVKWTDPKNIRNYYSVHIKNQHQPMHYRPYMVNHIISDEIADGKEMSFAMVLKGREYNAYYDNFYTQEEQDSFVYKLGEFFCFEIGDSVSVKLSAIDNITYNVWESWYRNMLTDGNPFTNPATVKTNINAPEGKRGRGFWMGYACNYYCVYISGKDTLVNIGNF